MNNIETMMLTVDKALSVMEAAGKQIDELKAENASLRQVIEQAQQAEPVALPKTPSDISNMIGLSFVWREHKISDVEPHEEDKYCVTAHDLLESFEHWSSYTSLPPRQPLMDEEIDQLLPEIVSDGTFTVITYGRAVARAIEAAHGIKGEA